MKFIRYQNQGAVALGVLSADGRAVLPLAPVLGRPLCSVQALIESWRESDLALLRQALATGDGLIPLEQITLLAPIAKPVHDILCVGVNYKAHREETRDKLTQFDDPPKPVYFSKRAVQLLGPGDALHSRPDLDDQLDYEVELAVILGKRCKDVTPQQAEDAIFGYSVFNDYSSRQIQKQHVQWFRGKSLDTYAAMGPCILHKSALPFPVEVDVISRVNGEVRQHSNTNLFLTALPQIIADFSAGMTLEPGDIIATGTPGGVGVGFTPPKFIKAGDLVECEIPPIGLLHNPIL